MQSEVIWTAQVGTAATDGAYVYVNPDFFRGLPSDGQRAFLLAHEVGHIVLRHPLRGKAYRLRGFHSMQGAQRIEWHPQTWNMSGDYVINADLLAHGLEPIPAGLFDSKINRDALVDNVYIDLMNKVRPDQPGQPDKPGQPVKGDDEEQEGGGTRWRPDTSGTDDADTDGGTADTSGTDDSRSRSLHANRGGSGQDRRARGDRRFRTRRPEAMQRTAGFTTVSRRSRRGIRTPVQSCAKT